MIIIKNGYTLSEGVQRDYTYSYQVTPSSLLRTVSAPAFDIIAESEDSSALALYTLQGDIIKVNNGVAFTESPFDIHNSEIALTAITEVGSGNYYFRWWAEYDQNLNRWLIYRAYRYRDGSETTTQVGRTFGQPPTWRLYCADVITQKNNYDNMIYPVARRVTIHWRGNTESWNQDSYLTSQNRRVLLSSQTLSRTDCLYTVTGGIITP